MEEKKTMIEIKNVDKSFFKKPVLSKINLTIQKGSIFGLVGVNGSGKSTLLRLIADVYKPDQGAIYIDGEDVKENEKAKAKIFFLPDEPYYDLKTTPQSLSEFYQAFYPLNEKKLDAILEEFSIDKKANIHNFSKGMKRQVFLALAIAIEPEYLLLDEAFDGLDPLARIKCKEYLIDLVEDKKTTIIISSHSLRELSDICDSFGIIDQNHILLEGNLQEKVSMYHKYQVAFLKEISKEMIPFPILQFKKDKRIVSFVCQLDEEEVSKQLEELAPVMIDELTIDFEELFILEVTREEEQSHEENA